MLLQCLCIESKVCTRTGYELYELLFVSLLVRHFFAYSHVQDTFKSSLYSTQVDQVKKNACFDTRLNVAFKCADHFTVENFT